MGGTWTVSATEGADAFITEPGSFVGLGGFYFTSRDNDGAVARIVQEAGRPQLGKGWGTPANADCSGFSVEEFENLDLTNVDFSEFTTQLMAKFSAPDGSGIVDRMKASFDSMMGSGSPGFGEVTEAKDEGP
mgnify:CR=1 FL=1